jgi:MalT-like TPR region
VLALAINGLAHVSLGEVDTGMRRLDAAAAAALGGEVSDVDAIETVCCFVIDACRRVRDLERAREWCERVQEVATRYGDRQMFSVCRTHHADVLMWQGDWDGADAELTAAARELASIRPGREVDALARLAELRRRQGRTTEADELVAAAAPHRFQMLVEARLALDRGDAVTALDAARRFLRLVGASDRFERVAGLELMVRAAAASGEECANTAARELAAIADATPTVPLRAAARLAEGRVAAASGDAAVAKGLLGEAVDLFALAGAKYDAALAQARARLTAGARRPRRGGVRRRDPRPTRARDTRRAPARAACRWSFRPRDRGPASRCPRVVERRHRSAARAQRPDGRAPRGQCVREGRRLRPHRSGSRDRVGAHARNYVARIVKLGTGADAGRDAR